MIWILALALVGFLSNKWMDHVADKDSVKSAVSMTEYNAAKDKTQDIDKQTQALQKSTDLLLSSIAAQQSVLLRQQAALNTSLAQQQAKDKTLPLDKLAQRWEELIGASGVVAGGDGDLHVDSTASVTTVQALEQIPVQKESIQNDQKIIQYNKDQIASLSNLSDSKSKEISSLNDQIKAGEKACYDKIDAVKAADRKGKRNWFLRGMGVGSAITVYIITHL